MSTKRRKSKKTITHDEGVTPQQWAREFQLPEIDEMFQAIADKVREAAVASFATWLAESLEEGTNLWTASEPGHLELYISEDILPQPMSIAWSLDDIVDESIHMHSNIRNGLDHATMRKWADVFRRAADKIDDAIKNTDDISERKG
jgi:hypothetical protein